MLVLSQPQVRALLDVGELLDALERALVELSAGRSSVPARTAAYVPGERGFLASMPGYVDGVLATKLVSVFHGNAERGLPSHQALIAVFDAESGQPVALMDGTHITAVRTGATSAVSTKTLAREDARVLTVIGTGVQARSHLEAARLVRPFQVVRVAGRDGARAAGLAAEFGGHALGIEEAVRGADVVCLCTAASEPVIRRDWLADGAHITSVGSSAELDAVTVEAADVLAVESRANAFQPFPAGAAELAGRDPESAVELGELLAGTRPGRAGRPDALTVFKSTGHAVEDAAAAALVLRRAESEGVGTTVAL